MARIVWMFVSVLALAQPGLPQTGAGTVQGTVSDASGAVVPGVRVTLKHVETAREYATATNEAGVYKFPPVQPGEYALSASAPGFDAWRGSLTLQAGQTAVVDPSLKVASATAEITVAGDVTPLVTVTSATLGSAIERVRIDQLPLNGRFFQSLVQATNPGLEGEAGQPRVYGLRASSMEFLQDGAVLTNRDRGGISTRPPGIDTIQEFKVETSNSSARMNRPATTIVSTRSGTNDFHGAAFETIRNNAIGVARRRQDFYEKAPHLVRNEFGASGGGPVLVPRLYNGRNRTFFFFAYEAYRLKSATTTSTRMPTMEMRSGDFSQMIDGVGRRLTQYDPWTTDARWGRTPFPNNIIPASRQSPVGKHYFAITPAPTHPQVNPLVSANYYGPSPANRLDHTETLRVDHRLSDGDQIFGRYSHGNSWDERRRGWASNGSPVLLDRSGNLEIVHVRNESAVFSWNHLFSPAFFSEMIATGSLEDWEFCLPNTTGDSNYAGKLGLPNPFGAVGLPDIRDLGLSGMVYQGIKPRNNITRIFAIDDNLTKIRGRHEFQFGGRYRDEFLDVLPDQQFMQGNHSFNSLATALYDPTTGSSYGAVPRTGHITANLFLGIARSYQVQFVRGWYNMRAREYAAYFQDNFKATPRLTLNFGVRYEFYPAIREKNNLLTGFDPAGKSVVNGAPLDRMYKLGVTTPAIVKTFTDIGVKFTTPEEAGLPAHLMYSNPWDFGPRAGFAYRLGSGKRAAVLRGGYALYGFPIPLRTFNARMRQNPPTNALFTVDINSAAQSPDGRANYGLRSAPAVIAGVNSKDVLDPNRPAAVARGSFMVSYFNPEQPTTRAHEWNLTLEREVWDNTVVRAAYVGTHGSRLDQYYSYNYAPNTYVWFMNTGEPLPTGAYANVIRRSFDQVTYGNIEEYRKSGWSNFNGAQVEVERRYSRGYGFQFFYVMSNALSAGGLGWEGDSIPEPNMFLKGAVPSDVQERNRFLNYRRDTTIPKHRMRWNWIADLPFGRGKRLAGGAGGLLDRLIGGWQIAGFGSMRSNYFQLPTGNYGALGKVEIYGTKYPIQDCRSGACIRGYLWYNGYIPANRINSTDAQGRPNGVMGVPPNYQASHKPLIPIPADGGSRSDPNFPYYDTDQVFVTLNNGTTQRVEIDDNLHPWRNQFLPGPRSWGLDASLFKRVKINERFGVRFNADFFNVLNMPGMPQPDVSAGIVSLRNSAQAARQLQLTLRLMW